MVEAVGAHTLSAFGAAFYRLGRSTTWPRRLELARFVIWMSEGLWATITKTAHRVCEIYFGAGV